MQLLKIVYYFQGNKTVVVKLFVFGSSKIHPEEQKLHFFHINQFRAIPPRRIDEIISDIVWLASIICLQPHLSVILKLLKLRLFTYEIFQIEEE